MRRSFLFLVLLLPCSCRGVDTSARTPPLSSAPAAQAAAANGEIPTPIEVVTDAAAVAAARTRASEEERKVLDVFFSNFESDLLTDSDMRRRFRGRPEPVARLRSIRDDERAAAGARAHAGALLCALEEESCWTGYARLLTGPPKMQRDALLRMDGLSGPFPRPPDEILTTIVRLLDSPDRGVRDGAVRACGQIGIPDAGPKLLAMLRQRGTAPKGHVAWALARDAPSLEAVTLTARLLSDPAQKDEPIRLALITFAGSSDPAVSQAAVAALARHATRPGASNDDRSTAMDTIARYGSATYVTALRAAAASDSYEGQRALAGLIRLGDAGAAERGLASITNDSFPTVVADALLRFGGDDARKRVLAAASRSSADTQTDLLWTVKGLTALQAATRLQSLGVIKAVPSPHAHVAARRETMGSQLHESWVLGYTLQESGAVLSFDTETGFLPVPHDLLLHDLAAISGGGFAPTAVWQEWKQKNDKDYDAEYEVQFVLNDRLYRFAAENLSDWYDLTAVLTAANRALADGGAKERFVSLFTGDQTARILYADPDAARRAAAEFLLALEDDPDRSRRDGRAFEAYAIGELLKKR